MVVAGLLAFLLLSGTAGAEGKVVYSMKDVKVEYAAEFKAYALDAGGKATVTGAVYNGTVTGSVYGEEALGAGELDVLYGVVQLIQQDGGSFKEEFIKVRGADGSVRALSNGGSYEYYPGGRFSRIHTEFAIGKKLEGKAVVKDYKGPWRTVHLDRAFDDYQNLTGLDLSFHTTGVSDDPFWEELMKHTYRVDLSTYKYSGNQGAVKQ